MDTYGKIKQRLQELCQSSTSTPLVAKVVSVENDTTCTVDISGLQLSDVRLRAVVNDETSGVLVTPSVGSYVLLTDLSGGELRDLAVIMYSEVDKIEINGGDNGGLINVSDLVKKINTIEQDINNLKTVLSGWTPVAQDGGAALKTAAATWYSQSITQTKVKDIEDDKITH